MTRREIEREGFRRGYNIALDMEGFKIGEKIPLHLDWVGYGTVTRDNIRDVFCMVAGEVEQNARQYSPFEETANELNELQDKKPYDPWEVFDDGIQSGIYKAMRERLPMKEIRKMKAA